MALKGKAFTILLLFAFGITMAACAWESETTIGIDLGTTYSSVGVYRNGKVEIVPNEQGNRVTPSCVAFTDTEVLIGEAAKNQSHLNPERTIYDVKSIIGRKFDDPEVQRDMRMFPYKIINKDGKPYIEVKIRDGEKMVFSPEQISALVLRHLKEKAEVYLGQCIKNVVIAVPAYFNDVQVEATRDACTIAGLHVARVLKEPIAAAIAYDLDKEEDVEKNTLVFYLGSNTFGVTVLTIDDGVIQVSSAIGDNHLGGQDFDRMVMDYFINLINKKYNKDISQDKEAVGKLLRECKRAKMELGSQHQVLVKIKSLFDGVDFSEPLTKVRFEELNMDLLKKMIVLVKKALDGADLKRTDIHEIVLVGGGTRIPMVRQFLKDLFYGKEPLEGVNPEEAVAHGAAIQGWILRGPDDNDYSVWGPTIYLSPMSLGIETVGGLMTTVIARDTHIPTRKSHIFTTYQDWQTTVAVKIYEGERALTKDCRELGSFNLSGITPARRGVAQIEVTFFVDHNDILHVTALDKATRIRNSITIPNGVGLYIAGKEMRRKIMEAGKFAGEDRKAVARIEGRKKLETYFKTKSSVNGIDNLTGKIEVEDEKDLKNALKDVMEWLDELDKKVNDWEDVLGPVLKTACRKSGTTSAIHDEL